MGQAVKVFVSRTSDIAAFPAPRSFAQAAIDAVVRCGMVAMDMRYFPAGDCPPAPYCRRRVRDCDILVMVVGFRYGTIAPGEAVSFTEMEFDEATAAGIPRLVFLLDENFDIPAGAADADTGLVDGFRRRLRDAGLIVATFTSPASLELEVFHALTQLMESCWPILMPRRWRRLTARLGDH